MTTTMKQKQVALFRKVLKDFNEEMVKRFESKLHKRTGWTTSGRAGQIAADLAKDAVNQDRSGILYSGDGLKVRRPQKNVDIANRAMMLWNIGRQKQQVEYRQRFEVK